MSIWSRTTAGKDHPINGAPYHRIQGSIPQRLSNRAPGRRRFANRRKMTGFPAIEAGQAPADVTGLECTSVFLDKITNDGFVRGKSALLVAGNLVCHHPVITPVLGHIQEGETG